MPGWYAILKVVHVLAVVVWVGGAIALAGVTMRLQRAGDRATLAAFIPQAGRYGHTMGAPASLLVLLTGIAMVIVGNVGFRPLWVSWGFAGIVLHFVFGALVLRKRNIALAAAAAASPVDEGRIADAGSRLRVATAVYLLIMASVIVVMVFKPSL